MPTGVSTPTCWLSLNGSNPLIPQPVRMLPSSALKLAPATLLRCSEPENLFRALRQYADARFNYVLDTLLLKQVAGILTPDDILALNEWLQSEG